MQGPPHPGHPAGAERAFEGEHQLQASIDYTAQAAADGRGFVYQVEGAEPIVARLAAFNLASRTYRPPPAIDETGVGASSPAAPAVAAAAPAVLRPESAGSAYSPDPVVTSQPPQQAAIPPRASSAGLPGPGRPVPRSPGDSPGDATVRAFYDALGAGDGATASAYVVPEKRTSRTFSPAAMSQFYGRLPEPIRLTRIAAIGPGTYRVRYRYSAGRSHCDGTAIVSVTRRANRDLIRSIRALGGC